MTSELMAVLTAVEPPSDRLSVQHLELRDRALRSLANAQQAIGELQAMERGDEHERVLSPRYENVRKINENVGTLIGWLDRTYV